MSAGNKLSFLPERPVENNRLFFEHNSAFASHKYALLLTKPFDEHAALDDLLAELFGEQVVIAVDNVELVEEEHVEEGDELDQVAS